MTRSRCAVRPALECLESRDTPAGTIAATFSGGTLTLTGDAADNLLFVYQNPDDRLVIAGFQTQVRLNGGPLTPGFILPAPLSGGMTIKLGGGADGLVLSGTDLPGSLTVNGGSGGNTVTVANGLTVHGNFAITNGAGFDQTNLYDSVHVTGAFAIANGAGGSKVLGDSTTDLLIGGAFTVASGYGGADTVALGDAARLTAGRIAVSCASQMNTVDLTLVTTLAVAGGIRVNGGPYFDTVTLGGATMAVGGGITINAGTGVNKVTIQPAGSLSVGGTVHVTGGSKHDEVRIGGGGSATAIGGGIFISVGDGGSIAFVEGSELLVGGSIGIRSGAGLDVTNILAMDGGAIAGSVTISQGAGDGQDLFVGTDTPAKTLAIGGSLSITSGDAANVHEGNTINLLSVSVRLGTTILTGAGADLIKVNDSVFGDLFTLATGDEIDKVFIEQQGTAGTTRFRGTVRVNTGADNDLVNVGNSTVADRVMFSGSSLWDGGAGTGDNIVILGSGNVFYGSMPAMMRFEAVA
jgi:hypothetical protein